MKDQLAAGCSSINILGDTSKSNVPVVEVGDGVNQVLE